MALDRPDQPQRLLIVLPNWVGDVVLASPVLAAVRARWPKARITYLLRSYIREIVAGCDWHDFDLAWPSKSGPGSILQMYDLARRLRQEHLDLAVLLTNSFRSALVSWLAGVPQRVGYAREGRAWMLTQRLRPLRKDGEFVPSPILPYYCALAEAIGATVPDRRLRLGIAPDQLRQGRELQRHYKLEPPASYAIVNPGAAFGASKCWLPERFAALCDRLFEELSLQPVLVGSPNEAALLRHIVSKARRPVICCDNPGTSLGSLKVLIRDASLLVCNDTGPRHYGSAFGVPTITIFGPTHQQWTDTDNLREIKLQAQVPCGPCQLKSCPLDLRCMRELSTEVVFEACRQGLCQRVAC